MSESPVVSAIAPPAMSEALEALDVLHEAAAKQGLYHARYASVRDALRTAQARIAELEEQHGLDKDFIAGAALAADKATDRATKAEAQLARAVEVLGDLPEIPDSFKFTGTSGHDLESVFDNELRHKSGANPADYLFGWLPIFRPFAYATKDDSWGELEKLICTTLRNYVQVLINARAAAAFIKEIEG